jgi:hypothetical protein
MLDAVYRRIGFADLHGGRSFYRGAGHSKD